MNCLQCAGKMKTQKENYSYRECGLSGITLIGVAVSRCKECGEFEVAIPKIEELHRIIALSVIRKPARLSPKEIRFLRTYLGWSGVDFADYMGVKPETVSRWEKGDQLIGMPTDRLLRLMIATKQPRKDYSLEILKTVEPKPSSQTRIQMKIYDGRWEPIAA